MSIEAIQYRLYLLEKIRSGLADVEAGRIVPHDEVKARRSVVSQVVV